MPRRIQLFLSFTSMITGRPSDSTAGTSAYPLIGKPTSRPIPINRGEPVKGNSCGVFMTMS